LSVRSATAEGAPARRLGAGAVRGLVHIGLLGASQAGVTVTAFATQVILARGLAQADFGRFMATVSLTTLVVPLALVGTGEFWLQRFGREGARAYRWVRVSGRVVMAATLAAMAGLACWGLLDRSDPIGGTLRVVLAPLVAGQVAIALAVAVLQLRGAYSRIAALQLLPQLGRLSVAAATWVLGLSVIAAAIGYAAVAVGCVGVALVLLRPLWAERLPLAGHAGRADGARRRVPSTRNTIGGSTPFMLGSVFYLVGLHLGVVVTAASLSAESAALLAVPMAILTAVFLIPRVVYQQYFLPKLHRWSRHDRTAILAAYRLGTAGMTALGALCAAVVAATGWVMVPLLFGEEYAAAVPILALLALAIPLRFGSASVASLLTSGGQVRQKVFYQGIGAAVYVIALVVGIRSWGLPGAAVATVATEGIQFYLFWRCVQRNVIRGEELPRWTAIRARLANG